MNRFVTKAGFGQHHSVRWKPESGAQCPDCDLGLSEACTGDTQQLFKEITKHYLPSRIGNTIYTSNSIKFYSRALTLLFVWYDHSIEL